MEKSLSMTIVVIICISDVLSTGSPWDWQSVNAKYSRRNKENDNAGLASSKVTINVANITVHQGQTALLPCRVEQLNQYTVSWLRAKDTSVLSVGQHIFSSDKRMSVKLESLSSPFVSIWTLQIDSVSVKDEGWYDCQVNTEPKVSHQSYLHIEPKSPPRRGALHSKELSDAPSNPQVIPEIQHFLKSMKKQNNEARLKLQIREGAGSQKLQPLRDGDPLVLECVILPSSASLNKLDQMSTDLYWIREGSGEALSIDVRSRRRQVPQKGKATLIFSSVIQSDEGSYTCLSQDPKVDSATIQINLSESLLALQVPPSRGHSSSLTAAILWLMLLCTAIF